MRPGRGTAHLNRCFPVRESRFSQGFSVLGYPFKSLEPFKFLEQFFFTPATSLASSGANSRKIGLMVKVPGAMSQPLVKDIILNIVAAAIEQARAEGVLQLEASPNIQIERPSNPSHGDFATSLPLQLARATRINPLKLAEMVVERIPDTIELERVALANWRGRLVRGTS